MNTLSRITTPASAVGGRIAPRTLLTLRTTALGLAGSALATGSAFARKH